MTDKQEPNQYDSLMDTQRLLQGIDPSAEENISLESILAEYGSHSHSVSGDQAPAPAAGDDISSG